MFFAYVDDNFILVFFRTEESLSIYIELSEIKLLNWDINVSTLNA